MTNITSGFPSTVNNIAPALAATPKISVVAAATAGQALLAADANRIKVLFRFARANTNAVYICPVTGTETQAAAIDFTAGENMIEEGAYTFAQVAWKSWGVGSVVIWEWIKS